MAHVEFLYGYSQGDFQALPSRAAGPLPYEVAFPFQYAEPQDTPVPPGSWPPASRQITFRLGDSFGLTPPKPIDQTDVRPHHDPFVNPDEVSAYELPFPIDD